LTSLEDAQSWQILRDRLESLAEDWCTTISETSLSPRSPVEIRETLSRLIERIIAFLLAEEPDGAEPRAIGAALGGLRLRPKACGLIQARLAQLLLGDLPHDLRSALAPSAALLLDGLATGFVERDRTTLLDEQEHIRAAYVRALRQAERDLLLKDAGIESSISAFCLYDPAGEVTYVNQAFLGLWGYEDRQDVIGRQLADLGVVADGVQRIFAGLKREDGWIGELTAEREDGSRFAVHASASLIRDEAGRPLRVMSSFVDVTERKRAEQALERRATQMAFLNQIGEEIVALREPGEVLEKAVHLARKTFDYHQVAVLVLDRDRGELAVGAMAGVLRDELPGDLRVPIGHGITGWVARHGEALVSNDVAVEPRYINSIPSRVPTCSELAVPIRSGADVIGVLDVQSPHLDAFGADDRIVLETLADQIAVSLENARLYKALQEELAQRRKAEEALRRNLRRLETLHDIDRAILAARSRDEVMEAALRHLQQLVPCQRCSIDLVDLQSGELVVLAAVHRDGEGCAEAGARFPLTRIEPLAEWGGQHDSIYIRDVRELPRSSAYVQTVRAEGLRSFLVAPIGFRDELIGILTLGSDQAGGFEPEDRPIVEELADSVAIALQQARLLDSVRRQREQLRDTLARLAEAEEAERRHVVQALHDRVGQNLTALDLNLSLVRSQLDEGGLPQLGARLDDSLSLVAQTNARIRQVMSDLRPPVLDDYGLLSALEWYGSRVSSRTGIRIAVGGDDQTARDLPSRVQNTLFRISQEALNNVVKHARATRVTIDLSASEAAIFLTIRDDGAGFEEQEVVSSDTWGFLTMRERAESVGARCSIESDPGRGTCVTVEVPT
jgi:PAS domain S-box-containing protein